jgi:hypothetical protein
LTISGVTTRTATFRKDTNQSKFKTTHSLVCLANQFAFRDGDLKLPTRSFVSKSLQTRHLCHNLAVGDGQPITNEQQPEK